VTRTYQNHHLDSTHWVGFEPRDDDVIITTSYKSGTTFTQTILMSLLCGAVPGLDELEKTSPWIDERPVSIDDTFGTLRRQTHRRFIKSHLPLDGLPYYPHLRYLIVARDPRDVFMSFANHYGNYTAFAYAVLNDDQPGEPLPPFERDIHQLWRNWITRGWFDWESEGYPFWGNMHHTRTYWDYRHLPNFLFLHYADMLADLEGTIRRIAAFIDHPVTDGEVARVAAEVNFSNMKKKALAADIKTSDDEPSFFAGGNTSFIFKGTNGRWREVLTEQDLDLYEAAKNQLLSPDCARWLEQGGALPGSSPAG
jgi:aryl sulfotransferase